ncbi:Outer membrane protein/protective antigen OMA87 [Anaplasma centrale str. Israel]|uniref:Outer membrane protein assembly factor BamA n=1 Tax=Anaplasma centrale (strain Israel) TaxID=574556 RepID=D1ATR0_ANACI|nr:outer membrane protein assembly factor BamA [Anaplasma centrale]ACZ48938.1 Outer membrane protein/protective antigen OMA87 [Anaplasma centrale str. Israel]
MRYIFVFALYVVACVSIVGSVVPASAAAGVTRVRVVGNERLDSGTVQFYAKVPLTGDVTQPQIDEAIKNLYSTSLFSRVGVRVEGNELVIRVKENPVVRSIKIVGNRVFSDKNLENDVLKMKKMSIFTEAKLKRDLSTLHALYQSRGMLGAKVSYAVRRAPHNAVDIVLKIVEGRSTRIGEIRFVGNREFPSSKLKAVIYSREHKLKEAFGLLGSSTKFLSERLMIDQSLLREFYTSRGFLDFRVKSVVSEVSRDLTRATVVFSVEEGKKYQFGDSIVTVRDVAHSYEGIEEDLLGLVLSKKGAVFDATMVNGSVASMTAHLNERGNLFASVTSDYDVQGDVVNVKYSVSLGHSVYIHRINIVGNNRTLDHVIRRKLGVYEGDVYSTGAVRQSRKRLADMDFFETVDVETRKVSDSLVDLNFKVKERGTGSFDIGAGFSSESGLVGKVSVRERNVLGTGKMIAFDLSRSMTSLSGTLDLVTPNVFDSDVAFGMGVFYSRQGSSSPAGSGGGVFGGLLPSSEGSFSSTNAGLSTRLSCSLTDSVATSLQYSYKYHSIHNVGASASTYIKEQEGRHLDSAIGYSLVYSNLDSVYRPSRGVFAKVSQSFSGIGGNLHYVKTEASSAHFFPVFRRIHSDIVLKIKPSFGYVFAYLGETVKIGQRFFAGNSEIRGFAASGIGPRDRTTKESLGGKLFYGVTAQFDFPIGLPEHLGIRGSVFADVASLSRLDAKAGGYDTSDLPRLSVGFGFSWQSPFGPVRIDFGFPLVKEKFDIKDRIRISTDAGI